MLGRAANTCWFQHESLEESNNQAAMLGTKRIPAEIRFSTPLIRQWQLLEWLASTTTGVRVARAAKAFDVDAKMIRRDMILLRHLGFDLKETTEGPGRKVWWIDKPVQDRRRPADLPVDKGC
jgi:hypothetical protein